MSRTLARLAGAVRSHRLHDPQAPLAVLAPGQGAASREAAAGRPATIEAEHDREFLEYGYNLYNTMDEASPRTLFRAGSRLAKRILKRLLGRVLVQQTRWNRIAQRMLLGLDDGMAAQQARIDRLQTAVGNRPRVEPLERRLDRLEGELSTLQADLALLAKSFERIDRLLGEEKDAAVIARRPATSDAPPRGGGG